MTTPLQVSTSSEEMLDVGRLRQAIQKEYTVVAAEPSRGFHFHTGRALTQMLGYEESWLAGVPEASIESFAGTGNPFTLGQLRPGERVVDVASGAGIDSLIAATALVHGFAVVTRNVEDFSRCGVTCVNPWDQ